jgi:protein-S-isoprenylcysteine O-methyltransferase Ste14
MAETTSSSRRRTAASMLYVAAWPAAMLVLGGDWRWLEGWLFAVWLVGLYLATTMWMHAKDPALLAERRRRQHHGTGQSRSDRMLLVLMFLGFAAWIILMPLDARRYHWTAGFPVAVNLAGAGLLVLSAFFVFRAFHDNTFLSGEVRVQTDRQHRVVSDGVYSFVRHPMYLGMVLMFAGAPLLVGSKVALGVAAGITLVLVARITREERVLAAHLDGYDEYRRVVRYRLLPLVW